MAKKLLIFCFAIPMLFSCSRSETIPSGILEPQKMQNIMWEILQSQSIIAEQFSKDSLLDKESTLRVYIQEVYKLNGTDSVNYTRSYNWYVAHPAIMKTFLDSLYQKKLREKNPPLPKGSRPGKFIK